MKHKYCKKGELYYLRLPHGYLRVEYIGLKDHKRLFNTVSGTTQYILTAEETTRLIARVPRQKGALKRLANYKKFRAGR